MDSTTYTQSIVFPSPAVRERAFELMGSHDTFSFGALIPCPAELRDCSPDIPGNAIRPLLGLSNERPSREYVCTLLRLQAPLAQTIIIHDIADRIMASYNHPETPGAVESGRRLLDNMRRYGYSDWSCWALFNWGDCDETIGASDIHDAEWCESSVAFQTPRHPVPNVVRELARTLKTPLLYQYTQEVGGENGAIIFDKNGDIADAPYPYKRLIPEVAFFERGDPNRYIVYFECWGRNAHRWAYSSNKSDLRPICPQGSPTADDLHAFAAEHPGYTQLPQYDVVTQAFLERTGAHLDLISGEYAGEDSPVQEREREESFEGEIPDSTGRDTQARDENQMQEAAVAVCVDRNDESSQSQGLPQGPLYDLRREFALELQSIGAKVDSRSDPAPSEMYEDLYTHYISKGIVPSSGTLNVLMGQRLFLDNELDFIMQNFEQASLGRNPATAPSVSMVLAHTTNLVYRALSKEADGTYTLWCAESDDLKCGMRFSTFSKQSYGDESASTEPLLGYPIFIKTAIFDTELVVEWQYAYTAQEIADPQGNYLSIRWPILAPNPVSKGISRAQAIGNVMIDSPAVPGTDRVHSLLELRVHDKVLPFYSLFTERAILAGILNEDTANSMERDIGRITKGIDLASFTEDDLVTRSVEGEYRVIDVQADTRTVTLLSLGQDAIVQKRLCTSASVPELPRPRALITIDVAVMDPNVITSWSERHIQKK